MRWFGLPLLVPCLFAFPETTHAEEVTSTPSDGAQAPSETAPSETAPSEAASPPAAEPSAPTTEVVTPPAGGEATTKPTVEDTKAKAPPEPPLYYVEPQEPRRPAPNHAERPYEPPPPMPYYYPPPPRPVLPPKAPPKTALWLGARAGSFVPFGSVWFNQADYGAGLFYRPRAFSDYASTGVAVEIDVGARLSRRYNLFALFEHAALPPGGLDQHELGGQRWGASNLYGAGLRFSSNPNSAGLLMEIALGYREFHTSWGDGTRLSLKGALDARLGIGADVRITRQFALSPMLVLGVGSFDSRSFSGPNAAALFDPTAARQPGEYGTLKLEVGFHADLL